MGLELLVDHLGRPHSGVRKWLESLQLQSLSAPAPVTPVKADPEGGTDPRDPGREPATDSPGDDVIYLEIAATGSPDEDLADAGMSTVEYAIGTVVAAAFAAVLYRIVTGDSIVSGLTSLVQSALTTNF